MVQLAELPQNAAHADGSVRKIRGNGFSRMLERGTRHVETWAENVAKRVNAYTFSIDDKTIPPR